MATRMMIRAAATNLRRSVVSTTNSSIIPKCLAASSILQSNMYSTSKVSLKIYKINSDMTDEEIEKMFAEEIAKEEALKIEREYRDWKPGMRKRPLLVSRNLEDFDDSIQRWIPRFNKRVGALAIKVGMMPVWDDWGERHPCTVLFMDSNVVLRHNVLDTHMSVQIGAGARKAKNVTKPLLGHFRRCGLEINGSAPCIVREFRVTHKEYMPPEMTKIHASHFLPGQNVDVSGVTKGKGFQGGMKRHGFAGMPASHGTSKSHRSIGSTGQCQDPGRVFKGKKMPGRMGGTRVTVQNLRVVKIDRGRDLVFVKGAVPGNKGGFVEIRDSVKAPLFGTDLVLGHGGENASVFPPLPTFEYETAVDGCGEPGHELLMPLGKKDPFIPDEVAP